MSILICFMVNQGSLLDLQASRMKIYFNGGGRNNLYPIHVNYFNST